jgi:hypothetical protein
MKRRTSFLIRTLALILLAAVTIHCGSEAADSAATPQSVEQTLEAATSQLAKATSPAKRGTIAATMSHPCDVFTLADVKALFDVAGESVKVERGEVPGNFTCEYEWQKADWEEIDKRNEAGYLKVITGKAGPGGLEKYLATLEPENAKVFITFHGGDFKSEAVAIQSFDGMVEGFRKGMGTKDFMVQAEFDPSEGVATKAAWSDKLRQLSIVSGTTLFHVKVERNADRALDRVDAEQIARRIHASL